MPLIDVPTKGVIEFPDSMTMEEIESAIRTNILAPTILGTAKEAVKALPRGALGFLEQATTGAAALLPEDWEKPVVAKAHEYAQRFSPKIAPGYEESIPVKLAEGIGSMVAPILIPGGAAIKAATFGAAGAGEARQRARQAGATPEQLSTATAEGIVPGLVDVLPFHYLMGSIGKTAVNGLLSRGVRMASTGGMEGATEWGQQVMQNAIAQGYDPKQDLQAGASESGAYGAGVGALAQGLMDMVLGRRGGKARVATAPVTPAPAGTAPSMTEAPPEVAPPVPEDPLQAPFEVSAEDVTRRLQGEFAKRKQSAEPTITPPVASAPIAAPVADNLPRRRGNQIQGNLFTNAEAPIPKAALQEAPAPETVETPTPPQPRLPFLLDKHTIDTLGIKGFGSKKLKADLIGVDVMTPEGRNKLEETLGKAQKLDVKAEEFLGLLPPITEPAVTEPAVTEPVIAGVPESGASGEGTEQPIPQPISAGVGTPEAGRPGVGAIVEPSDKPAAGEIAQPSALETLDTLREEINTVANETKQAAKTLDDARNNDDIAKIDATRQLLQTKTAEMDALVTKREQLKEQKTAPIAKDKPVVTPIAKAKPVVAPKAKQVAAPVEKPITDADLDEFDAAQRGEPAPVKTRKEKPVGRVAAPLTKEEMSAPKEEAADYEDVLSEAGIRRSQGKTTAPTGSTVKSVTAKIKNTFGGNNGFDRITTVVQSETDLPRDLRKPGVKGVVQKGRIYLVADNIASGEELGVFLHEAGGHLGFDRALGAEGRANLAKQVRGWAKGNDLKGLAAQEAVRKGGESDDEVIAYTVEELVNRGVQPTSFSAEGNWLKRIMAAFRAALKRIGFTQDLTSKDLVDAAFGAAHIEMTGIDNVRSDYAEGVKLEKQLFGKSASKNAEGAYESQRGTYNYIRNNFGLDPVDKWDTVPLDRIQNSRMDSLVEREISPETRMAEKKSAPRYSTANPAMDAVDSHTLDLVTGVSAPNSIVNNAINTVAGPGGGSIAQKIRQNMASRLTWWEDWFASLHGNNALDAANLASANDRLQASTKVKNIQLATLEMGGFGKNAKGLWEAQHTDASYKDVMASVDKMIGKYAQTPDFASAEKYFNLAAIAKREEGLMASKQTTDTGGVIKRALSNAQLKMGLDIYRTTPEVREALDTYKKFNDRNVDSLVTAGVIDAATAKDLKGNAGYVPWFRFVQDKQGNIDIKAVKQFSKGLTNLSDMRDLEGGRIEDVQINNVLDNMAMLSNWMVNKSVGNDTAAYMTKIAVAYGRARKVGSPIAPGVDPKRVVQILDNGNPTFYQFDDPMALPAFKGYEAAHGAMTEILAAPTRWLRKGITLFPVFSLAQLPQDTMRAMVTGGLKNPYALPTKVISNFIKEIFGGSTTSQRLAQFGIIGRGIDLPTEEISKGFRRRLGVDTELNLFQRGIDLLEKISNASDAAVRAALYEQTMKETGNEVLAIRRARDIINFDIQGSSGYSSFLRQTVPFMGVYMNDLNNLYKGLVLGGSRLSEGEKKATRQAIIASGLNLAFLTMLYTLFVSDDDDYKNLNDPTRNRSFIIPGTNLRIPVPGDGIGLLFKVLPEQLTRLYLAEGMDSADIGSRVGRALFKGFADMGSYENWIPGGTVPKVFSELILNKSFYTGNPIVGKSKENLAPFKQYSEGTSETSKMLAESMKEVGIGLSPIKLDYLVRNLGGQIGGTLLGISNALFVAAEGKTTPSLRLEDIPEIKSFTYSSQDKDALDNFYELRDKIDTVARTYKDMISAGKGKEALEYMSDPENRKVFALRGIQTRVEQDLAKIRKQRKFVTDNQNLSEDQMREELTKLDKIQEKYLNSMRLPTLRAYANVETNTSTNLSKLLR